VIAVHNLLLFLLQKNYKSLGISKITKSIFALRNNKAFVVFVVFLKKKSVRGQSVTR
jgi:hypothetical protein